MVKSDDHCPAHDRCSYKECRLEGVCLNAGYWSKYWREKSIPPPEVRITTAPIAGPPFPFKIMCCYCDRLIRYKQALTTEHLVPLSLGGNNTAANKRDCCIQCNAERSNKALDQWIRELYEKLAKIDTDKRDFLILAAKIKNALYFRQYVLDQGAKLYKEGKFLPTARNGPYRSYSGPQKLRANL